MSELCSHLTCSVNKVFLFQCAVFEYSISGPCRTAMKHFFKFVLIDYNSNNLLTLES